MDIAISKNNIPIRLTDERWMNISTGHPEIADYYYDILETVENPEKIMEGGSGELIATVTIHDNSERFMVVVYKELDQSDGFVITAYLTNKLSGLEKRRLIWEQQK
jgi:hypothetical protein